MQLHKLVNSLVNACFMLPFAALFLLLAAPILREALEILMGK